MWTVLDFQNTQPHLANRHSQEVERLTGVQVMRWQYINFYPDDSKPIGPQIQEAILELERTRLFEWEDLIVNPPDQYAYPWIRELERAANTRLRNIPIIHWQKDTGLMEAIY